MVWSQWPWKRRSFFEISKASQIQDGGLTEKWRNKKVLVFDVLQSLKVWKRSDKNYGPTHTQTNSLSQNNRWRRKRKFSNGHISGTDGPILTFLVSMERSRRGASEKTYFEMIRSRLDLVKWLKLKISPNFQMAISMEAVGRFQSLWAFSGPMSRGLSSDTQFKSDAHSGKKFQISCIYRRVGLSALGCFRHSRQLSPAVIYLYLFIY